MSTETDDVLSEGMEEAYSRAENRYLNEIDSFLDKADNADVNQSDAKLGRKIIEAEYLLDNPEEIDNSLESEGGCNSLTDHILEGNNELVRSMIDQTKEFLDTSVLMAGAYSLENTDQKQYTIDSDSLRGYLKSSMVDDSVLDVSSGEDLDRLKNEYNKIESLNQKLE